MDNADTNSTNNINNSGDYNKRGKKLINKYDNKKNFSEKLRNGYPQKNLSEEDTMKLFGKEEKDILLKLLPQNEVDKLEKKFELVQKTKIASDKKNQMEIKLLSKKVTELEERMEYTNLHNKELEQRNKINGYQINEHKNENKLLSRKINEANVNLTNNKLILKQKDDENRKLHLKMQDLQKEKDIMEKKLEVFENNKNEIEKNENEKKNNEENEENEHQNEDNEENEENKNEENEED